MTDALTPYTAVAALVGCALTFGIVRISGAACAYLRAQTDIRRLEARARARELDPPEPVCGCTHHFSFHDPETRNCRHQTTVKTSYLFGSELVQCACQQYTGPEHLPAVYAP